MRCCFCGDNEATEKLSFCKPCFDDPGVPSYQYVKVARHEWESFFRWKEIWMSWWWVEGRRKYKNPLKKNGKPKKEKWVKLYNSRDEQSAKLLVLQIKAASAAGKEGTKDSKHRDRELDMLRRFDDYRVVAPELPPAKRSKRPSKSEGTTGEQARCPECDERNAKRVLKGERRLWKCLSCGHRWPRASEALSRRRREAPEKPSKGLKAKSGTRVAEKPPRRPKKKQKRT